MSLTQTKGIEVLALLRGLEAATVRNRAILEGEAGEASKGLVTKVAKLQSENKDLKAENKKLKEDLEKEKTERKSEIEKVRSDLQKSDEKIVSDDKKDTEKRDERITSLEKWRWMMMGGAAAAGGAGSFVQLLVGG
jgi:regulator of replication initiation timing